MKPSFIYTAGLLALAAIGSAQPKKEVRIEEQVYAFQQGSIVTAPGSEPVLAGMIGADGRMGLLNVTGKPFSATETRRTVQVLANGAKIENSNSNLLYRDDQGRTRVEQTFDGRTTVVIMDPVARFVAVLDRATKTVHKTQIPADAVNGGVSLADGKVMVRMGNTNSSRQIVESHSVAPSSAGDHPRNDQVLITGAGLHPAVEDLGQKVVNGLLSTGTRQTLTLPTGAIGNDRDLQIVDEHWFAPDLQLVVKSVNSDPRFGETTYQLTNILRGAQDPALFQVPADYAVTENTRFNLPEMKLGK